MANYNLLEIYYDRITGTEKVTLTQFNCYKYGYRYYTKVVDGSTIEYYVNISTNQVLTDSNNNYINEIEVATTSKFTHIAPPPSKYEISYADVDKEGSGRNSLTGEMFRERIGYYTMLTISWDLIPNTIEYHNWYKVLTKLPEKVYLKLLMPNGDIEEKAYYRGDISTNLYWFIKDREMWQGLSTTFTEWYVNEYDDNEPTLQNVTTEETINENPKVKVSKNGITKTIQEHNLDEYLKLNWVLVK